MSCRIVFMGTPGFAVPCLQRLLDDGYDVAGVFSQPDKPKGRGYQLAAPPVKELALQYNIPVFQPTKMRDGTALATLQSLQPDLAVVVAYGRILPPELLAVPRLGCINVHASLLPKLRGAAPVQWSVINGDAVTGVTTMYMAEGLDTGDMIMTEKTPIGPEETAEELFDRLSLLGAECLSKTVPLLLSDDAPRRPQNDAEATWAPLLDKSVAKIDFTKTSLEICNLIRGLLPSPVAFTRLDGKLLKIHSARPVAGFSCPAGQILSADPLLVGTVDGAIELVTVQPEGKKAMPGADFARGKRLIPGRMFTAD